MIPPRSGKENRWHSRVVLAGVRAQVGRCFFALLLAGPVIAAESTEVLVEIRPVDGESAGALFSAEMLDGSSPDHGKQSSKQQTAGEDGVFL